MKNQAIASSTVSRAGKYLTVTLAHESYGINVQGIREIIRLPKLTPLPRMPDYVKGVINLRGRIIPIADLRIKFGLAAEITERTCIVVVQIKRADGSLLPMGLIVDAVEEVVNLVDADIQPTPEFGVKIDTSYLMGMAKVKGEVKTLLDINQVVSPDALRQIAGAAS